MDVMKCRSFVVECDVHFVAYSDRICTSNAFQAEIAFDFAVDDLAFVGLHLIPATCVFGLLVRARLRI